jgi:hypothetical protein
MASKGDRYVYLGRDGTLYWDDARNRRRRVVPRLRLVGALVLVLNAVRVALHLAGQIGSGRWWYGW